jgi:hypothetical protein
MKRTIAVLLATVLMVGIPAALFAKAEIVKITITGADLATPLEITDFGKFRDADVNVWAGPGVKINGQEQTEGFITDWPLGAVADRPSGLHHYEVSFYTKLPEGGLVYVVYYDYDPSSEKGFIYLPGKHDKWFNLNYGTICHGDGFEGNWFLATAAWNNSVRPLIARAKLIESCSCRCVDCPPQKALVPDSGRSYSSLRSQRGSGPL